MADITTLQLARKIADAAIAQYRDALEAAGEYLGLMLSPCDPGCDCMLHHIEAVLASSDEDDTKDRPTQAVIRVMHETDSWFCRLSEDAAGATVEQPMEVIQASLF